MTATLPLLIWEDGGAVFLDKTSRTVILERPMALGLQYLLYETPPPDCASLRDWMLARFGTSVMETDWATLHSDLMDIREQVIAEHSLT